VANGWVIAVLEENGKVNLARYTPQFGDHSDLAVPPADLMKTGESGPRAQVDRLPHEQNFYFSLHFDRPTKKVPSAQELGRMKQTGTGLLRITDLGWATAQAGQQVVESMRFDVVIQLLAIHGVPVYGNSLGVVPPKAIYTPDPQYSREARRAGFQGTVVLWMVVDVDGYPAAVKVVRSVGMGLDEKAVDAVRKWKFIPGLKDGKPVPIQINVEVAFRL
jgi:TonB family protein